MRRVYPRGCGGTRLSRYARNSASGLSPRVRGNRAARGSHGRYQGSIPAGAGEPSSCFRPSLRSRVYPRGCGGTGAEMSVIDPNPGLSPRVRGNLTEWPTCALAEGSIPAGAGEPDVGRLQEHPARVYPRGCGGTHRPPCDRAGDQGLSPRVRGNRSEHGGPKRSRGSIPAGAGEPAAPPRTSSTRRVYPRGCGGTGDYTIAEAKTGGLSPRVRGNPKRRARRRRRLGSIPAGAGEPPTSSATQSTRRVYPRGCGGTRVRAACQPAAPGLSPRVRGNPGGGGADFPSSGSIPAGAGEPPQLAGRRSAGRVYPRGCGGTDVREDRIADGYGLSPRVRGNPVLRRPPCAADGSIPAGAGEPRSCGRSASRRRVYPRGCGGTEPEQIVRRSPLGLSPRVRGNQ